MIQEGEQAAAGSLLPFELHFLMRRHELALSTAENYLTRLLEQSISPPSSSSSSGQPRPSPNSHLSHSERALCVAIQALFELGRAEEAFVLVYSHYFTLSHPAFHSIVESKSAEDAERFIAEMTNVHPSILKLLYLLRRHFEGAQPQRSLDLIGPYVQRVRAFAKSGDPAVEVDEELCVNYITHAVLPNEGEAAARLCLEEMSPALTYEMKARMAAELDNCIISVRTRRPAIEESLPNGPAPQASPAAHQGAGGEAAVPGEHLPKTRVLPSQSAQTPAWATWRLLGLPEKLLASLRSPQQLLEAMKRALIAWGRAYPAAAVSLALALAAALAAVAGSMAPPAWRAALRKSLQSRETAQVCNPFCLQAIAIQLVFLLSSPLAHAVVSLRGATCMFANARARFFSRCHIHVGPRLELLGKRGSFSCCHLLVLGGYSR